MDTTEIKFTLTLPEVPEIHRLEAERKAKEAYIMTLLRHGDISAGRAAELLEIERWQLSDLMDSYKISPFPTQTKEELQQEVMQTLEILNQYKKVIIVSDATPLSELAKVGQLNLLRDIFGKVIIPQEVYNEVTTGTHPAVNLVKLADWIEIRSVINLEKVSKLVFSC